MLKYKITCCISKETPATKIFTRSLHDARPISLFNHVLKSSETELLEKGDVLPATLDPNVVHHLPYEMQQAYLQVFSTAVHAAFQMAAVVMALAFILSLFLPESPLRSKAKQ